MTEHRVQGSSICTYTGLYVDPLNLKPEDIRIDDIAHALANQCRYSGHTAHHYSVAQHSVYVSQILDGTDYELEGLLHDAQEAYLQDMARPLKEHEQFGRAYREAEAKAEQVIAEVFQLRCPMPAAVKSADMILLATERRDIMPPGKEWAILDGVLVLDWSVGQWTPEFAKEEFLMRFHDLAPWWVEHELQAMLSR